MPIAASHTRPAGADIYRVVDGADGATSVRSRGWRPGIAAFRIQCGDTAQDS